MMNIYYSNLKIFWLLSDKISLQWSSIKLANYDMKSRQFSRKIGKRCSVKLKGQKVFNARNIKVCENSKVLGKCENVLFTKKQSKMTIQYRTDAFFCHSVRKTTFCSSQLLLLCSKFTAYWNAIAHHYLRAATRLLRKMGFVSK